MYDMYLMLDLLTTCSEWQRVPHTTQHSEETESSRGWSSDAPWGAFYLMPLHLRLSFICSWIPCSHLHS